MGSSDAIARNLGVPANTTEELIQYAKENPGALEYGSSSAFGHLVTESFAHATGVDFLHVPSTPEMQEKMFNIGFVTTPSTPADFSQLLQDEIQEWKTVIETAGIQKE